jgi:hypothetical protein
VACCGASAGLLASLRLAVVFMTRAGLHPAPGAVTDSDGWSTHGLAPFSLRITPSTWDRFRGSMR